MSEEVTGGFYHGDGRMRNIKPLKLGLHGVRVVDSDCEDVPDSV